MDDLTSHQENQIREFLEKIVIPRASFHFSYRIEYNTIELYLKVKVMDADTWANSRGKYIPTEEISVMTKQELPVRLLFPEFDLDGEYLLQVCFRMYLEFMVHEAKEWFLFDGKQIYDPHDELSQTAL